ncbi:hypothetical protein ACB098_01G046000 [Castanea mollissima]
MPNHTQKPSKTHAEPRNHQNSPPLPPISHQTHKKLGPQAPDPSFSQKPNHHQPLETHSEETTTITHTKQLKTHKNSQPITSIGQIPRIHHLSLQNQPNRHPKFPSLLNCIKPTTIQTAPP